MLSEMVLISGVGYFCGLQYIMFLFCKVKTVAVALSCFTCVYKRGCSFSVMINLSALRSNGIPSAMQQLTVPWHG